MKYKIGDKVRIKSLGWYKKNKNKFGKVWTSGKGDEIPFDKYMSKWCGKVMTISDVRADHYTMIEDLEGYWTDEMIEGLVEEETKPEPKFKIGSKVILAPYPCIVADFQWKDSLHGFVYTVRGDDFSKIVKEDELAFDERPTPTTDKIIKNIQADWNNFKDRYNIPDDYHFVDKNGNEINISEIVLEKKKPKYPKTYEECCEVLGIGIHGHYAVGYNSNTLSIFQNLFICRNAYWKIAGEEMGLGRPWSPSDSDYITGRYCIFVHRGNIICDTPAQDCILTFPTAEMRDAFYENFKEDIEECKELLQ